MEFPSKQFGVQLATRLIKWRVTQVYPAGVHKFGAGSSSRSGLKAFDPEYGCLIQKEPILLTPKGLHSNGIYHNADVVYKMMGQSVNTPALPLSRPPLVESSFNGAPTVAPLVANSRTPTENYYATTDIIHVSLKHDYAN